MDRMACVDLPAFPLQLLLQSHRDWQNQPAAVVDSDKPQGIILYVNERARALRILPGMRYAAALSLAGRLRAGVVPQKEIERAVRKLSRRLRNFTPHVEPAADEPGVFRIDASGLERLHDSLARWAALIRSDLRHRGFHNTVVVGFSRFGTYALARSRRGVTVFDKPADEHEAARRVPLDRLSFRPAIRDTLRKLGVVTVGQFIDLPTEGITKRFGKEIHRLHRLASNQLPLPLQPVQPVEPAWQRMHLDHAETNVTRLLYVIERLLQPLLETLAGRGHALCEIRIGFRFERTGDHIERIRPAAPTLNASQLLELIRLRLEAARKLPDGVTEVVLIGDGTRAKREQLDLFGLQPKRDRAAADRALARVRAELGDAAVTRARLREGHLPEGSFTWERLDNLPAPAPRTIETSRLVRRVYTRPVPLPSRPRQEPDGWMPRSLEQGPVVRTLGPYIVSGGWWNRPIHREYHFTESQKGEILWVYYDRPRRKWFLHGRVE